MSTLDQAFIRAYQATSARKAPTTAEPVATPSAAAPPATSDAPRRYFVDPPHAAAYAPHYGEGAAPGHEFADDRAEAAERLAVRLAQANIAAAAVATEPVPIDELHANYETQRFAWPRKLEVLIAAAGGEFADFAAELEQRSRDDRKTLLVTGAERGAGRSLVALALARLAANRNLRTAIVDLDLSQPSLAELLGVRPELGWDDACAERLPMADALIESHDDRLSFLPLRNGLANPRALAGNRFLDDALTRLRKHFDYIVIDGGPLADDTATIDLATALGGHSIDDALVVRDRRRTTPQQVHDVGRRLAALGVRHWDLAENFTEIQGY